MSNTKTSGAEKDLQDFCLNYFNNDSSILQTYDLKCKAGAKVLGNITCIKEQGQPFQMACSLSEVDLAFYTTASTDIKDIREIPFFKFTQVPKEIRNEIIIPFFIIELKRGPITSDALRARNQVAQKTKQLFPFCPYVFLGDETKKTGASVWQHGKDFNDYFLFKEKITQTQLTEIDECYIQPHFKKLEKLELLPT